MQIPRMEAAYALVNGAIADYSNSMQQQIDIMVESANAGSEGSQEPADGDIPGCYHEKHDNYHD